MNLPHALEKQLVCVLMTVGTSLVCSGCNATPATAQVVQTHTSGWIKIDDFESPQSLQRWTFRDIENQTNPRIENPQVSEIREEPGKHNRYFIKKPAAEGVVGNRKALSYLELPVPVAIGETYTFYTRINVEYFPNNHAFGLSNLYPEDFKQHGYNSFEPALRVTDKWESDGSTNDGTLMAIKGEGKNWHKIYNYEEGGSARPMQSDTWYELWYVVNNSPAEQGGQSYDVYVRGGDEFPRQKIVFKNAGFRVKRELPLIYFLMTCNTGPVDRPYGNGGLRYDDLYMAKGVLLSAPDASN